MCLQSEIVMREIISKVEYFVFGTPLLVILTLTGIYLSVGTGFFQIIRLKQWLRITAGSLFSKERKVYTSGNSGELSRFQCLCTSLAAKIGTGNIAGVATAITLGGPGSVFWMWISAFFGMMTAFGESVLGIYYRQKNIHGEWNGGAMYYLQYGLGSKRGFKVSGRLLACLFALFCIFASLGIGNMAQINSVSSAFNKNFGVEPIISGAVLTVTVAFVSLGGIRRVGSITENLVPFMAIFYVIGTLTIILQNCHELPHAVSLIFEEAFSTRAAVGGIGGSVMINALNVGVKRGIFSNEAGLGSSVLVNCTSDIREPAEQGMWGIFEVFVDTILICTLTALTLLVSDVELYDSDFTGVPLVTAAFAGFFGDWAGKLLAIAVFMFAFSTVVGWLCCGCKAWEYLFGLSSVHIYKIAFIAVIIPGAMLDIHIVWQVSDIFNGLMAIPNLIGVIGLSGTIFRILRNYIDRNIYGKNVTAMISAYKYQRGYLQ